MTSFGYLACTYLEEPPARRGLANRVEHVLVQDAPVGDKGRKQQGHLLMPPKAVQ